MMEQSTLRAHTLAALGEPLYRLALLATGSTASAQRRLVQACAALAPDCADIETALLAGLLPGPAHYGRWQPDALALQRANLDRAQARALLGVVARRPVASRLVIGMHYLRGMPAAGIAAVLGMAAPDASAALAAFRAEATLALGEAAPDASAATLVALDQALDGALAAPQLDALRGQIFADAALRAQRDALIRTRALLPQLLPALFAVAAPPQLLPRLAAPSAPARRPRRHAPRAALAAVVGSVLLVAALIIVAPGLLPRRATPTVSRSAPAVLDAAIHRFEHPPIGQGILHERYRAEPSSGPPQIIERWYDYGAPSRLAVDVRDASTAQPGFGLRTDGQGMIQYRLDQPAGSAGARLDYQMTAAEVQAALPVLRGMLTPNRLLSGGRTQADISGLYLAQARTLGPALLGRTNAGGRAAWLLRYTTDRLPGERAAGAPRQVVLTIDAQLDALLDVTVLQTGSGESTAARPWHAELVELLDQVPASQFAFAPSANVQTVRGPHSLLLPDVPRSEFTSLQAAQRTSAQPLLAPRTAPAATRGVVLALGAAATNRYGLLYEGEFQSLMIFPGDGFARGGTTLEAEEHVIGAYRYRLAARRTDWHGGMLAVVYRADAPQEHTSVVLLDAYATPAEQAQHMRTLLASLAPVTAANVQALATQFVAASQAGE